MRCIGYDRGANSRRERGALSLPMSHPSSALASLGHLLPQGRREKTSVLASEAKQSSATRKGWIASSQVLLAMTKSSGCLKSESENLSPARLQRALLHVERRQHQQSCAVDRPARDGRPVQQRRIIGKFLQASGDRGHPREGGERQR